MATRQAKEIPVCAATGLGKRVMSPIEFGNVTQDRKLELYC